jgi:hypothetical protein
MEVLKMQTHSVNAIAEQLERDRGTIVKSLRNVPPDATVNGRPQWKIATASRAVEGHLRSGGSGHQYRGGGRGTTDVDPVLTGLYEQYDCAEAAMRTLPTVEERRTAAVALAPLIAETDRALRAHGHNVGIDPELTGYRADRIYMLVLRGLESPTEWSQADVWEKIGAAAL